MKILNIIFLIILAECAALNGTKYSIPEEIWPENLGNHRAVLEVDDPGAAVAVDLTWRRHDSNPEKKQFIIIHQESGEMVENIHRVFVDNERCRLVFGPANNKGKYLFYYLPYIVQQDYGFYNKDYLKKENRPDKSWLNDNQLAKIDFEQLPKARLLEYQSRTAFDSFYPMEVTALKAEKDLLLKIYPDDFLVFPEDRRFPIRMLDEIPKKWVKGGPLNQFEGQAYKNEYYTFQLGVFAARKNVDNLKIEFSSLMNDNSEIPAANLTCFNTGGIDPYGVPFIKRVDIEQGNVQPLWIGIDVKRDMPAGRYQGTIRLISEKAKPQSVNVSLNIKDKILVDRGDSENWRHSRLRWLNSTLGIDDKPAKPFQPISNPEEFRYSFSDKEMTISENGFPGSILIKNNDILHRPVSFIIETLKRKENFSEPQQIEYLKNEPGIVTATWKSYSENVELSGLGTLEADGYINYKINLKSLTSIEIKDIRLEIPFSNKIARYMMGMGLPGTAVPKMHTAKWKGPHDSFWIGGTNAGLWCELRGSSYHGPLLNLYKPEYPDSWFNENKGGFRIENKSMEVNAVVFSGRRSMEKGDELDFEWSMLITPVRDIDYNSQFIDRYYHNGGNPLPSDEDLECNVKIVNLHHANNYNPHINYPFVAVDSMKWFVNKMHEKGKKVKIYYTIRELTNYTTEIWALRSLGDEILGQGRGGGYPWLREHLVSDYHPQWYQYFPDKSADASIVNAPGASRWYNYYIEGLAWLIKNVDIDGLYLDDVSYDRRTVKRIRKVLDNLKEGCLLDLHSNTGFSKGPATQYAEFFPYMDKLWFGESFKYDKMSPENWLVEVSGIPFGLMGDMLHGGGNRWLGMLFGMTVRHPWTTEGVTCDPRPVWKIWDDFNIETAKMVGFWDEEMVAVTSDPGVKVTAYIKDGETLLSVGNFSDKTKTVSLKIDFEKLGLSAEKVSLIAPAIQDFQSKMQWRIGEKISIEPRKGWLIYVQI